MSLTSQNHIKIGSSTINSISKGNFSIGVSGGADYGPTVDTGFYNGIPIPIGGYVIYVEKVSGGPSIHAPRTDEECLYYLNRYGANAGNISDALSWAGNQSNLFVRSSEYTLSDLPSNSFTIYTNSFNNMNTGYGVSSIGTIGFTNNGNSNLIDNTVYLFNPNIGNVWGEAVNAASNASMDYTNYAYAWHVTWADNTTGLCRVGIDNSVLILSPINESDTRWQSGNTSSNSKAGTYGFPATFTPYTPLTTLGGNTAWC